MIAVDTSALMAIVLKESQAVACKAALEAEDEILISAGTMAEALIVSARRNVGVQMARIIDELGFEIVAVTPAAARRIAEAYRQWGRGLHPAGLRADSGDFGSSGGQPLTLPRFARVPPSPRQRGEGKNRAASSLAPLAGRGLG